MFIVAGGNPRLLPLNDSQLGQWASKVFWEIQTIVEKLKSMLIKNLFFKLQSATK